MTKRRETRLRHRTEGTARGTGRTRRVRDHALCSRAHVRRRFVEVEEQHPLVHRERSWCRGPLDPDPVSAEPRLELDV